MCLKGAIVVDIGGTSSDAGYFIASVILLAFYHCFVSMQYSVSVGPESVGYQLTTQAKIFGGEILTSSCIAVATKMADIGNRDHVNDLPEKLLTSAKNEMQRLLEDLIDLVKVNIGINVNISNQALFLNT